MTRRCSHCGHNGHNSRTCPDRGVRIFGVRLADNFMRKSVSTGNLNHYANATALPTTPEHSDNGGNQEGYNSDGAGQSSSNNKERKKGVPWTEEEHRLFLIGLNKLGKGDWRGISRNFVQTRTPTQVASHAQKYFIRQNNLNKRKRRSSLFDIGTDITTAKGLGRSMSTPSLPTLVEDSESPDSPTLDLQQIQNEQKLPPYFPPPMLQSNHPSRIPLTPTPFVLPPMFDVNCPQNFPNALPPFSFHTHFNPPMGFPMHIPIMHGLPVDLPHPVHNTKQSNESQFPKLNEEVNNPSVSSQSPHLTNWTMPLDPALSHRMGYELMMKMRENSLNQPIESKNLTKSSSHPDFPKEETASSWQKTQEEEESTSMATLDVIMNNAQESNAQTEKYGNRDDYFKRMSFQNPYMFSQFPMPYAAFNPSHSYLIPPPHPTSNFHPGIHRPRPSMAPMSSAIPNRDGVCDESSMKNSPDNTPPSVEPSPLSLKLLENGQERQSAFHSKASFGPSGLNNEPRDVSSSPISVV